MIGRSIARRNLKNNDHLDNITHQSLHKFLCRNVVFMNQFKHSLGRNYESINNNNDKK